MSAPNKMMAEAVRLAYGSEVVPVPLASLREVDSNDVPAITDTPKTSDPSGFAGLLGKDSTPILEYINGDTDSCLRLNWASGNTDPIVFGVPLPNIDEGKDIEVHLRAGMAAGNDTPTLALDSYFNEGDTKVEDASAALDGTMTDVAVTIAAADIPSGAQKLTVEITPAAHATDALYLSAVWVEYERSLSYGQ